ncbi:MAG: aminomethyl-transferring glycine dehydrogenase [Saprospiraceae bacterium]|nr:aminomethyl-transferring glycine dehydrogenase [Saprospiraceae bacterium]
MNQFFSHDHFVDRHIGPNTEELEQMLNTIQVESLDTLIEQTIPNTIRRQDKLNVPPAMSEFDYLNELKETASLNKVNKNYIGMGYYGTITPSVIARNVFHNPGWYTQYTPYQAEVSQGRLESLLNYQTMIIDLTGLPISNASLLDEGTAAAEAMNMFYHEKNSKNKGEAINKFLVSNKVFPQTIDILKTRANPLGIEIVVGDIQQMNFDEKCFGILLQYPDKEGNVVNFRALAAKAKAAGLYVTVAADILSLALLTPPGEWGADCAVGNTQRFGVPMGFGGPHAAYFATKEEFKRQMPGRLIGMSIDANGKPALRMALQTREQHIKREKATSNICTAQALLANMAAMYAVYHGPKGIRAIATKVHRLTQLLNKELNKLGYTTSHSNFFDTIHLSLDDSTKNALQAKTLANNINLYVGKTSVQISVDETTSLKDIETLIQIFAAVKNSTELIDPQANLGTNIPTDLVRTSTYLTHPIFNMHHTESNMMRYLKRLENKDISLVHSMISLGSCTMKLNAAAEMFPVSWTEFADLHPFAPSNQTKGYQKVFDELSQWLINITGFDACSLQPNSGAQGEYAGLLTIKAYHDAKGDTHRNVALIPSSAHGTNPASAVMVGMKVVVVSCDERGNIDMNDLKAKAELHKNELSCLMVTYPSTHGVFEVSIKEICAIIHQNGGKVYMDGANMNAQVGLTSPGLIGADVCHLNLHKTFAIPHGGGGPGMGPICCNSSLAPYLPGHVYANVGGANHTTAVSAAPWGSASILLISYGYIKMLGAEGLTDSTKYAILNANYLKARLEKEFSVLYTGDKGRAAHELIVDLRQFKAAHVGAEDVAKRLIDYGFHAPTLSFPVAGTIMIEPTESESKDELDRFCDALLEIKKEIEAIAAGNADAENNVLLNAPHPVEIVSGSEWNYPYTREQAAYPLPYLRHGYKFWPAVARVNNAHGDRNLVCSCPPIEEYMN